MTINAEKSATAMEWEGLWRLSKDKWFRNALYQDRITYILKEWFLGRIVLDIGCGTGDYLTRLGDVCSPVGLDISIEALRLAPGRRVLGSAERLPFRSGSIGGVFSIGTFHCLPRPEAMLAEARRVLRDDGLLVLVVPSAHSIPALLRRCFGRILRPIFRFLEEDAIPETHRLFSPRVLDSLLAENGYRTIDVEMLHIGYAFKSPLIRLPLRLVEKLGLRRMAEEIVAVCRPVP
ncbi:MAG: class I SAM-dependent methyltransferase [bacterium]|nr:class I SAM-dependent methyltransferase [bacterium]